MQAKSISSAASSPQSSYGTASGSSRQCKMNAKTLIDIGFCEKKNTVHRQMVATTITGASGAAMSTASTANSIATCSSSSGGCNSNFTSIGKEKRHSNVTESTVSGCESDISAATTVAICDSGYGQPPDCGEEIGGHCGSRRRRLAINITANPGYQVMKFIPHTHNNLVWVKVLLPS